MNLQNPLRISSMALIGAWWASCALASIPNPASMYCVALGYEHTLEGATGYCILPDGQKVEEWQFLRGEVGSEFGYCARLGYEQATVDSYRICGHMGTGTCGVCILPDGSMVEIVKLMGIVSGPTTCGDGSCRAPENFATCPADCPSGGWDAYCDGVEDGICDPDCLLADQDPDCVDTDLDGVPDIIDNCPDVYNPRQTDSDIDGIGNFCDWDCPILDRDGRSRVDLGDFTAFAHDWRSVGMEMVSDLNGDGIADMKDVALFSAYWLSHCYMEPTP